MKNLPFGRMYDDDDEPEASEPKIQKIEIKETKIKKKEVKEAKP